MLLCLMVSSMLLEDKVGLVSQLITFLNYNSLLDGVQCLNHVERFCPKENKWTKVAPMTTRRLGVAVAVLGGFLYAIGGSDGATPLNTVERYDPRQNKWAVVAPMSTRRKHLGCAVFNNFIYAVGGRVSFALI